MKHQGLDELRSVLRQAKMKCGWPTVASITLQRLRFKDTLELDLMKANASYTRSLR
jgi:hypothetical protein